MTAMERTLGHMINPWLLERLGEDRHREMIGADHRHDISVDPPSAAAAPFTYGTLAVIDGSGPFVRALRPPAPLTLRARLGWSLGGLGARLTRS